MTTNLHSLKVGIDFGTTYSGVAWAHTATPEEVHVIQKWPASGNRNSEKVPTEIAYFPNGTHKWGFELPLEMEKLVWIKLLLDPSKYASSTSKEGPSQMSRTKKLMPPSKAAVDVVADYLRSLKNHTMETLERNFGKEFLDATPVDIILAVPAVWSDAAKALTMQAAIAAGLGTRQSIQLISEPDAAAVCTLKDIQPNHLRVNDTFIVADCGGGTVDLISYQIVALEPNLEVKECAVGTGGMCGSTYINTNFEDFVRSRIGDAFDNMKPKGRLVMMKHFDEFLKRTFSDDEDEDIFSCPIPGVPDNPEAGVEDGFFVLTREDMREIFEPVIAEILDLVQKQIDAVETRVVEEDVKEEKKETKETKAEEKTNVTEEKVEEKQEEEKEEEEEGHANLIEKEEKGEEENPDEKEEDKKQEEEADKEGEDKKQEEEADEKIEEKKEAEKKWVEVREIDAREAKPKEPKTLSISAILLVGGFGASEYLRQRLLSDLKIKGDAPIRIMQPANAWSAVVRGAVLRGLEGGIVRSRLARRSYGIECHETFDPDRHHESEIVYSEFHGGPKVYNCAWWFIKKGTEVAEDQPITFRLRRHWKVHWTGEMVFSDRLFASDLPVPPSRTRTSDSYTVCKLTSNLSGVSRDIFPRKTSPKGFDYWDINYHMVMKVQSAMLVFEFQFEGRTYGSVTAKYY